MKTGIEVIDNYLGGFDAGKNYLLFGHYGAGSLAFCLQFIYTGLISGERSAIIADDPPELLLAKAARMGFPLNDYLVDDSLVLLHYQAGVGERVIRFDSHKRVVSEIKHLAGEKPIERLAFLPIDPLIHFSNPNRLMRTTGNLIAAAKDLDATTLFITGGEDSAENSIFVQELKDASEAAIRFRLRDDGKKELLLDKLPEGMNVPRRHVYLIQSGVGIISREVIDEKLQIAPEARRSLLLFAEDSERESICNILDGAFNIDVAENKEDVLSRLLCGQTDFLLLSKDIGTAEDLCSELRQNNISLPIVVLSDKKRRVSERNRLLIFGADEVIEKPVRAADLRARVEALFRHNLIDDPYHGAKRLLEILDNTDGAARSRTGIDPETGMTDIETFAYAISDEVEKATAAGYAFCLAACRLPSGEDAWVKKLREKLREQDLICRFDGNKGFLLLPQTEREDAEALFERLFENGGDDDDDKSESAEEWKVSVYPGDASTSIELAGKALALFEDLPENLLKSLRKATTEDNKGI